MRKTFSSHSVTAFLLFTLSLGLHLGWLARPKEVVFDEVHFEQFVSQYLVGEYFFDVHPPLGKLVIAGVARLAGVAPTLGFQKVGAPYPDQQFIWLRFLPAVFGSLLAPLVYLLALRSTRSRTAAATAGVLILFENALLVQSKFVLLDAFLLIFGFWSVYLFLQSKLFCADGQWGGWAAIGAAVAAGLCIATKWTGIGFWGLLLVFGGLSVVRNNARYAPRAIVCYAALVVIPVVLYAATFFIHFVLLPQPGPGNLFMTERFRASQAAGYPLIDFPINLWEVNYEMYDSHSRMSGGHPDGSRWYTWPLMRQPIYYWAQNIGNAGDKGSSRRVYLLGNPVVWWVSAGLTVMFLLDFVRRFAWQGRRWVFRQSLSTKVRSASPMQSVDALLATGYLANLVPFAAIGRVTFLYHYAPSLIFSILIAAVMLERIQRWRTTIFGAVFSLTVLGFLAVAPVTFGASLKEWPLGGSSQLLSILLPNHVGR